MSRITLVIVISDIGLPAYLPENIRLEPSILGNAANSASTGLASGTRCGLLAFIRSAGMCHVLVAKSISSHVASRASPDLHAVITTNSKHRAPVPVTLCNAAMKANMFSAFTARWLVTGATLDALGNNLSRLPFQRAALYRACE